LFEEMHWLVLLAGAFLTQDSHDETVLVPSQIMRLSASTPDGLSDEVLALVEAVWQLFRQHVSVLQQGGAAMLSTQVTTTLLVFLRRWARVYFLLPERDYSVIRCVSSGRSGVLFFCSCVLQTNPRRI
jgi:hypothetical protein